MIRRNRCQEDPNSLPLENWRRSPGRPRTTWISRTWNPITSPWRKQPPLTIIQKRRLTLFGHLVRMDESADARRIPTAVPQSEWRRPVGRPYTSWMATLKNDLAWHNFTLEDAIESALNKPPWRLLAASGATHWWCMPNNDDDDDDEGSNWRGSESFTLETDVWRYALVVVHATNEEQEDNLI